MQLPTVVEEKLKTASLSQGASLCMKMEAAQNTFPVPHTLECGRRVHLSSQIVLLILLQRENSGYLHTLDHIATK